MSQNGIILSGIIDRNALTVANGIEGRSTGVITRRRNTKTNSEESVIDFVMISIDLVQDLVSINIDEEKDHVLTSITNTKKGVVTHESDHNSIITQFDLKWEHKELEERIEIFNFKDEVGQKKFRQLTEDTHTLSSIFDTNDDVEKQTKKFLKKLNGILHQCFKKIRIKTSDVTEIDKLFNERTRLRHKSDKESKDKISEIEKKLADQMAEDLFKIVKEEVKNIESDEGGFNSGHLWKLKRKLRPQHIDNPTAMLNKDGKLVTSKEELKETALLHFEKVQENRPVKAELEEYKEEREKLCEDRINSAKRNITPDWEEKDVKYVIKNLKKKKSRDPYGYSNEVIQCGGKDMLTAIYHCNIPLQCTTALCSKVFQKNQIN